MPDEQWGEDARVQANAAVLPKSPLHGTQDPSVTSHRGALGEPQFESSMHDAQTCRDGLHRGPSGAIVQSASAPQPHLPSTQKPEEHSALAAVVPSAAHVQDSPRERGVEFQSVVTGLTVPLTRLPAISTS